jgi:hypothetical protein
MRVTKRMLEVRLGRINRRLGTDYWLNNAPHYGGWQLTANKGSVIIQHRLAPREMLSYLDGLITGMDMLDGAYKYQ